MATITLHKSEFDGIGSILDKLCSCFGNYDSTIKDLKRTASAVDSTTCDLTEVIDDIANSEESKEEKVKKAKALNQKIETFVNSAVKHENDAAEEIKKKKEDFYKTYKYLKPDCEKLFGKIGAFFENLGKAIVKFVSENLIAIITAAVIILAAILIVVFLPGACAILAVIVGVVSALMGIGDIVCTVLTGKDFATWLDDKGFHVFSQIYKGLGWGLDIAGLILPIGAMTTAGKTALKNTVKETLKHPFKALGEAFKGGLNSIKLTFKSAFANGFKEGMKTLGKGALKFTGEKLGDMIGLNDLKNGWQLGKAFFSGKRGAELNNVAMKLLGLGGISSLDGTGREKYDELVTINKDDLNTAVGQHDLAGGKSSYSEMDFEYKPEAGSDASNALNDLRTGTSTSGSGVHNDMKTSFYNSVKGDEALANDLMEKTGIDMSNISSERDFSKALENSGFKLNTNINNADGKAMVSVVPSWANKATDGYSGSMRVLDVGDINSRYANSTVRDYNRFINTKQTLFGTKLGNDIMDKGFDLTVGKFSDYVWDYTGMSDKIETGFEKTLNIDLSDHPILKGLVVDRFSSNPTWIKDMSVADHFFGDTIKAAPRAVLEGVSGIRYW